METIDKARAVAKKHNLSDTQLDVLRRASRKYDEYYATTNTKLYSGEVSSYNLREETLAVLTERGLVAPGYRVNDEATRAKLEDQVQTLVKSAFEDARGNSPFETISDNGDIHLAWELVLYELTTAKFLINQLQETCYWITPAGRAIAVEWKEAIGAQEE